MVICLFIVLAGILYPGMSKDKTFYTWSENPAFSVSEYFSPAYAIGRYTGKFPVKKVRAIFAQESFGEIRYADSHKALPTEGIFATNYHVPKRGWYEFDVKIPSNKFFWLHQKSDSAMIGYRTLGFPIDALHYDIKNKRWNVYPYVNSLSILQEKKQVISSLWTKLKEKNTIKKPIIFSLIYWMVLLTVIIWAGYFMISIRRFGQLIGIIAIFEIFTFCYLAFYHGMFNAYKGSAFIPHRFRISRPLEHPMLKRIIFLSSTTKAKSSKLRIATDVPFHDNFVRLTGCYALMGYEMHPLERRFKEAIELAYGVPIGWSYYFDAIQPVHLSFFNNFSVAHFVNRNPNMLLDDEKPALIPGSPQFFVHNNPFILPRVYMLDKAVINTDEEQLSELVIGDLRQAVNVSFSDSMELRLLGMNIGKGSPSHFFDLQRTNPILKVDRKNPNNIETDVDVGTPAMLIFTEIWYPGWRATVDGEEAPIYRVNYCQRGVWLTKGKHRIKLWFLPKAWILGGWVSLGTTALLLAVVIASLCKKYTVCKVNLK